MMTLKQLVPDINNMLAMHPADLGGYILETLTSGYAVQNRLAHRGTYCGYVRNEYGLATREQEEQLSIVISTAWTWMEVNGLICPDPGANPSFHHITKRGHETKNSLGVRAMLSNQELPEHLLHPQLLFDVRPLFLQGRFDTAVFEAFKAVEVAVRTIGRFEPGKVGVALMHAAFHPETGPLTDRSLEGGERVALQQLMAGAIGSYKNPSSHRRVEIASDEAREMIILASHLLKITEDRGEKIQKERLAVDSGALPLDHT